MLSPSFDIFSVTFTQKMCKENRQKSKKRNKRYAASSVFTQEQFVLMLDTVCATLLCPYTSHGACTIDSINHLQSDVVNFAFTKDEKKKYIYTNATVTIKVLGFRFGEIYFFASKFYGRLYRP